jgi:hypothetical protein
MPPVSEQDFQELLTQYEAGVDRLKQFYSRVEIQATMITQAREGEGKPAFHQILYRSNGSLKRVDVSDIIDGTRRTRSGVIGERLSFEVTRQEGGRPYVSGMGSNKEQALEAMRRHCPVFSAPYGLFEGTILQFLREPDLVPTNIKTLNAGSEKVCSVSFERHIRAEGHKIDTYGSFTFLPTKAWALKDYTIGTKIKCKIVYEGEVEGIPLLKRAEYWDDHGAGKPRTGIRIIDVQSIRPATAPAKEFTLASFGLPEVQPDQGGGTHYMPYLVFAAGVGLILVGILLRKYAASK